jgi:hypothetical protein
MLSVSPFNSGRTRVFIACGSGNEGIAILEISTKRSVTPPKAESAQNGPIVHPGSCASGFDVVCSTQPMQSAIAKNSMGHCPQTVSSGRTARQSSIKMAMFVASCFRNALYRGAGNGKIKKSVTRRSLVG